MKPAHTLSLSLTAAAAALALAASPVGVSSARAQDYAAPPPAGVHGGWTLKQREDWLADRIDKAKDEHSISDDEADRVEHELDRIKHDEDKMRDRHDDQLTDEETAALEVRLDQLADQIHWLRENSFRRPW